MNYTQLVECLYRFGQLKNLSTVARISLLSLFHQWKLKGCPETFQMPLNAISELINASRPTILTAIKDIEKTKIINVKRGGPRVPNTYKVMVKVMVKELNINGVMLGCLGKATLPYSIYTNNNNINKDKNKTANKTNSYNNQSITKQKRNDNSPKKKLSVWQLTEIKKVCEQSLKDLKINGFEDAWGFHYDKKDIPEVKQLKQKLKKINKQIMEADS